MFKKHQPVWVEVNGKKPEGIVVGLEEKQGFKKYKYHIVYVKLSSGETITANEWMVHSLPE
jgi:hypothetical protein